MFYIVYVVVWTKEDEERNKLDWYSELEKAVLKETEGEMRAEKKEADEKLEKETLYKTSPKVGETAYEHMRQTEAEYERAPEENDDEKRRVGY
jgi:hypothetical protein